MTDPRPTASALRALDTDAWSQLLAVALPVVRRLPDLHVDALVKRLRSVPAARLVSGRSRDELADVLAREPVWAAVEAALPDDGERPWAATARAAPVESADMGAIEAERDALAARVAQLEQRERDLEERLRSVRLELDERRRAAEGAEARASAAQRRVDEVAAERDAARERSRQLEDRVAAAGRERARAVERAERRDESADRQREEELRTARREVDVLRRETAGLRDQLVAAAARHSRGDGHAEGRSEGDDDHESSGGRRGRPSTLPDGVVPGTRDAARWLVSAGRVLLVDGYNVTLALRPDDDLPGQRRWLEQAVGTLAQRRHVDATIVWDSRVGAGSSTRRHTGLTVRFTEPDAIADDDLVLHAQMVLGPDTPAVAVTDDRELRDRLAALGVDLLDTRSFGWLL